MLSYLNMMVVLFKRLQAFKPIERYMEDLNYRDSFTRIRHSITQRVSAGQLFDTNIMCLDDSEPISDSSTRFAEQPKSKEGQGFQATCYLPFSFEECQVHQQAIHTL